MESFTDSINYFAIIGFLCCTGFLTYSSYFILKELLEWFVHRTRYSSEGMFLFTCVALLSFLWYVLFLYAPFTITIS